MSAADPEQTRAIPAPAALGCAALVAAGLLAWSFHLQGGEADRAWRAVLINFLFFTPLAAGLVTWSAVVLASSGTWPGRLEACSLLGTGFALPSLIALGALWIWSADWSPWYGKAFHQGLWLDNSFVFLRDFGALLLFWVLAWLYRRRRRLGEGKTFAGWLVLAYALVFSLLGFDLGMALDPQWSSSLYGGYFFISGMYLAVVAWALMAIVRKGTDPDRIHDLGKLVFAFAILTTYMMYGQLLPIYYENLPRETRFVVPRLSGAWQGVSIFLLATIYLGPLVLLLSVRAKRSRALLGGVCGLLLIGLWVERWWLVAPVFEPWPRFGLVEVAASAAFFGLFGLGAGLTRRVIPPAPEREEGS